LRKIIRYISFDNAKAAERFGYTLIDAALSLATVPERGRFVPEFNDRKTRELIHGAYRIVYRVDLAKEAVFVSRFWHAAKLITAGDARS
jgi:toxin ParE1/3/4